MDNLLNTWEFKILTDYLKKRKPWFPPKIPKYEKNIKEFLREKRQIVVVGAKHSSTTNQNKKKAYMWRNFSSYLKEIFDHNERKMAEFFYDYFAKGEDYIKQHYSNELQKSAQLFHKRSSYWSYSPNKSFLDGVIEDTSKFIKDMFQPSPASSPTPSTRSPKRDFTPSSTPALATKAATGAKAAKTAMKKKRRYDLSQIQETEARKDIEKQIESSQRFWRTSGSSSANLNRSMNVNVFIVRCGGCGGFMTENTMENSNPKKAVEYYCYDCFHETLHMSDSEMERHYQAKRKKNGVTLADIYE